ncbi:MAG: DUF2262 domain-containing protein [Roseovarius sp.]
MTGKVVQDGDTWVWRIPDRGDVLLRHNEWGKTPASQDMPRLAAPLAQLDQLVATARDAITTKYHALWQDSWRQPGDADLTREEFAQAVTLMSVSYPSGQYLHNAFDMSFDDAGLFSGHAFFVSFKMDGTLQSVEMFG